MASTLEELENYIFNVKAMYDSDGNLDMDLFSSLTSPFGSARRALSNNLYGINHQQIKGILPENRDTYGLTFFTRPMLNLSDSNLRRARKFMPMLNNNSNSIQMYVRCMLSPRLMTTYFNYSPTEGDVGKDTPLSATEQQELQKAISSSSVGNIILATEQQRAIKSNLIDNKLAFIPVLTNTLTELSGWPDIVLPHYVSPEGKRKQQWIMADGAIDYYSSFDIDCTFQNIKDEPIIMLFDVWERYMSLVHEGRVAPHIDMEVEGEMDYNTRIYRLILDESKLFVKKISACGAAFPVNVPNGKFYDYSEESKYNTSNRSISIRFTCVGAEYSDYKLIDDFNQTNVVFNQDYKNWMNGEDSNLEVIPHKLLHLFNNRGYPYIDYANHQLKWLISTSSYTYKNVVKYLTEQVDPLAQVKYYY